MWDNSQRNCDPNITIYKIYSLIFSLICLSSVKFLRLKKGIFNPSNDSCEQYFEVKNDTTRKEEK